MVVVDHLPVKVYRILAEVKSEYLTAAQLKPRLATGDEATSALNTRTCCLSWLVSGNKTTTLCECCSLLNPILESVLGCVTQELF